MQRIYKCEVISYSPEVSRVRFGDMPNAAATSTARNRARHLGPERRRPQVLDAALAITVEQGVGQVTVGSVADRLQVTRPVIYACFADRVEIITALLERETEALQGALISALEAARGHKRQSAFIVGFQSMLRGVAERPDSWRVVFSAGPDPAVKGRFLRVRAQMAEATAAMLAPALTRWWGIDDADSKLPALIEFFLSSCEAAVRCLLDTSNPWGADDLGELYGRMIYTAFSAA
jgi:AcrR family transcriptional regulator